MRMTNSARNCLIGILVAGWLLAPMRLAAAPAPGLPESERRIIERLIAAVEQLPDAAFIRNGRSYDAAVAVRFLRGKWRARKLKVRSAEDFIEQVASRSSTTGRTYRIRFADGRETELAQFFHTLLRRIRAE